MMPRQSDPDGFLYQYFLDPARRTRSMHKWHHYFDVYEQYFAPCRGRAVTFLEIGVQKGGSLEMWRAYLGPEATIVGLDVDPACRAFDGADGGKTRVFIGDQADPAFLRAVLDEMGPPDAVLDDGGHTANQQIVSFETLYPVLRTPGAYLVEDTHTAFWPAFLDRPGGESFLDYAYQRCRDLYDWTRDFATFGTLGQHPDRRTAPLAASDFCRTTRSVQFFDSIVAFDKRPRPEPWHEIIAPTP